MPETERLEGRAVRGGGPVHKTVAAYGPLPQVRVGDDQSAARPHQRGEVARRRRPGILVEDVEEDVEAEHHVVGPGAASATEIGDGVTRAAAFATGLRDGRGTDVEGVDPVATPGQCTREPAPAAARVQYRERCAGAGRSADDGEEPAQSQGAEEFAARPVESGCPAAGRGVVLRAVGASP